MLKKMMDGFKSEEKEESMHDIAFTHEGNQYKGWAKPSGNGWHVVLNGVFFGEVSYVNNEWTTNSQREASLVQKVGEQLAHLQQSR